MSRPQNFVLAELLLLQQRVIGRKNRKVLERTGKKKAFLAATLLIRIRVNRNDFWQTLQNQNGQTELCALEVES